MDNSPKNNLFSNRSNLSTNIEPYESKSEIMTKVYIGDNKSVSYNPKSKKICPSDWIFTIFTLALIIIPTTLVLVVVIP